MCLAPILDRGIRDDALLGTNVYDGLLKSQRQIALVAKCQRTNHPRDAQVIMPTRFEPYMITDIEARLGGNGEPVPH